MTPSVPGQFEAFFDDAPTFPPGLAPLPDAVAHRLARAGNPLRTAVGPLVLALDDLPEAARLVAEADAAASVPVSPVVPAGRLGDALALAGQVAPALEVVSIELKTTPDDEAAWRREVAEAASAPVPVFVELTAAQVAGGGLDLLAEHGLRLKFRTGGVHAHLFPSPGAFATVLHEAVARSVPFKLTAGLHEAVRYTNAETGFTHHGFLNIALATEAARRGATLDELVALLESTDADVLADAARDSDGAWRASFTSFGTCSVAEPAESLHRLGLFPAGLS